MDAALLAGAVDAQGLGRVVADIALVKLGPLDLDPGQGLGFDYHGPKGMPVKVEWHRDDFYPRVGFKVPKNITLLFLPSRAPELNPVENLRQYLRQTYMSNRTFETCQDILESACEAWNCLIDQPWRIMSIGLRNWAHNGQSL